jgi:hypothetical protein
MDEYRVPTIEVLIDFVERYDRRIGLRMLYSRYNIPKHERDKYRELWSRFHEELPTAFEKEHTDASKNRKTEEDVCYSSTQPAKASTEESGRAEDVKEQTA